jgi:hypothetical protein
MLHQATPYQILSKSKGENNHTLPSQYLTITGPTTPDQATPYQIFEQK